MTVEEVFEKLCNHMRAGVQFHEDMTNAYYFLGLYGYAAVQHEQYEEELHAYNKLTKYYMTHYFRLIKIDNTQEYNIIPETWYKYSSQSVDDSTKRAAIKELMNKWANWEKDTKKLYEEMYFELTNLREVDAALKVQKLIKNVSKELSEVQKYILYLEAIGYDLIQIVDWQ